MVRPQLCSALAEGCRGDGIADDTACLQAALRRCATVELPGNVANLSDPRVFLSGSLQLFSGTTLLVRTGAVLRSSSVLSAFPLVAALPSYNVTRYRHADPLLVRRPHLRHRAFVWAVHAKDVRLAGGGTIDGQRARWFKRSMLRGSRRRRGGGGAGGRGGDASGPDRRLGERDAVREAEPPRLIECEYCERLTVEDLRLQDSPFWTVHPYASRDVVARRLVIRANGLNTDGIDPDSSENVLIDGCDIGVGDDAIAIKSGWGAAGLRFGRPTRNVTIRNSVARNRLAIGSELAGGVDGVLIENVTLQGVGASLFVKAPREAARGGGLSHLTVRHTRFVCDPLRPTGDWAPITLTQWFHDAAICSPLGHHSSFKLSAALDQRRMREALRWAPCNNASAVPPRLYPTLRDLLFEDLEFVDCSSTPYFLYLNALRDAPARNVTARRWKLRRSLPSLPRKGPSPEMRRHDAFMLCRGAQLTLDHVRGSRQPASANAAFVALLEKRRDSGGAQASRRSEATARWKSLASSLEQRRSPRLRALQRRSKHQKRRVAAALGSDEGTAIAATSARGEGRRLLGEQASPVEGDGELRELKIYSMLEACELSVAP